MTPFLFNSLFISYCNVLFALANRPTRVYRINCRGLGESGFSLYCTISSFFHKVIMYVLPELTPVGSFAGNGENIYLWYESKDYSWKLQLHLPRAKELIIKNTLCNIKLNWTMFRCVICFLLVGSFWFAWYWTQSGPVLVKVTVCYPTRQFLPIQYWFHYH